MTEPAKYYCPECGCTAARLARTDGTVWAVCDDSECTYQFRLTDD